jgi:putative FmdB family regulatory protein
MPIYEYACDKCNAEFEVEQRITDDPVKSCPQCRSRKVRRLISQTSFVLKGGGWYSDLYSSAKSDKGGPDKDGGPGGSAGGSGSKSESGSDAGSKSAASDGGKGSKGKGGKGAKAAA